MARQRRRRGRRSRGLLTLLLLCALCAGFFWWSNHTLEVRTFTFSSPRLPEGFAAAGTTPP